MTIFLAIFEQANGDKFLIQYQPTYSPRDRCVLIEILSIDYHPRPRSEWEVREEQRRQYPPMRKRGLVLDEAEQRAEAMMPTLRQERLKYGTMYSQQNISTWPTGATGPFP